MNHSTRLAAFAALILLCGHVDAAPTYTQSWSLDAGDSFGTNPLSVTNAYIRHETQGAQYWQPGTPGVWAEIIYEIDVPFVIQSATTNVTLTAYNAMHESGFNADSFAASYADISADGISYTNVWTSDPTTPTSWTYPSTVFDISGIVAGSDAVFIRSRMFMTVNYFGFNAAQFLRSGPGQLFNVEAVGVPEPSSVALLLSGAVCFGFIAVRRSLRESHSWQTRGTTEAATK